MRIKLTDPTDVPALLAFLEERVHVVAAQTASDEIEVSQLGSMNEEARRVELDLLLQSWQRENAGVAAAIVAD